MNRKKTILLMTIITLILFANYSAIAKSEMNLNHFFNNGVQELRYSNSNEFKANYNQGEYMNYLPYLKIDEDGNGEINMGGELNSLFFSDKKEQKISWEKNLFSNYKRRIQRVRVISHLYNRMVYNHKQEEIYDNILSQANNIYKNLNKKKTDKGVLADLKTTLQLKKYQASKKIKGSNSLKIKLKNLMRNIDFESETFNYYPESIVDEPVYKVDEIVSVKMYKDGNQISNMKNRLKKLKRSKWPKLSLNYGYSFDTDFEETKQELKLSLTDNFGLTDYDRVNYSSSYSVEKGDYKEDNDDEEDEENQDNQASLSLFSYPRYKNRNNREDNLKAQISQAKARRKERKGKHKQELEKEIDKINHFHTLYQIERGRQVKFEKKEFDSKVEKLRFLIDKLEYQLKLEEYKFNYSYLYSRLKRKNKESKKLLKILKNQS